MTGLYYLLPALFTVFLSFLIVRAAAIALMMTGLDRKRAVFQALSAFTGTGFTTQEAERVINHPLRRKIISLLMILGNAGIVTVVITATSSLVTTKGYGIPLHVVLLVAGILVIYRIGTSKGFVRKWESFILDRLVKLPAFEEGAVEDLLHLLEGYGLVRATVKKGSSIEGSSLSECTLCHTGIMVLGIERGNTWIPVPDSVEKIRAGDKLVLYGDLKILKSVLKEI